MRRQSSGVVSINTDLDASFRTAVTACFRHSNLANAARVVTSLKLLTILTNEFFLQYYVLQWFLRIDDDISENKLEEADDVSYETEVNNCDDDLGTVADSASSCQPFGVSQCCEVFGQQNDDIPQRRGTGDVTQRTDRIQ